MKITEKLEAHEKVLFPYLTADANGWQHWLDTDGGNKATACLFPYLSVDYHFSDIFVCTLTVVPTRR